MLNDDDIRALKPGDWIYSCRGNSAALNVYKVEIGPRGGVKLQVHYTLQSRAGRRNVIMTLTRAYFDCWSPTPARAVMERVSHDRASTLTF